jgi:glycosyltransferase involved in cell wall biosynthesis
MGGAETVLYRLISATYKDTQHSVVSLHTDGVYGEMLRKIGVQVHSLGMTRGRVTFSGLKKLRAIIRDQAPDVVQTRMYHADFLGGIASFLAGNRRVVWAMHATELGPFLISWKTRIVRSACAALSKVIPRLIVTDAQKCAQLHESLGYPRRKIVVIPNGVDLEKYSFDESRRSQVRNELGIKPNQFLIGLCARWDPQKDHANLLEALSLLTIARPNVHCVLAGGGMTDENKDLTLLIKKFNLRERVQLLGLRSDVPALMNALDLHVLSSNSESQPIAVIEAMACGTPCVVTDVGEAAWIVGDAGWVAPHSNPHALALTIESAINSLDGKERLEHVTACQERARLYFGLDSMVQKYLSVWKYAANQQSVDFNLIRH